MADENLTSDEREAVIKLLRETIATDLYPLSPRVRRLKSALAKLDPSSVSEERPKPAPARSARLQAEYAGAAKEAAATMEWSDDPQECRTHRRARYLP